MKIIYAGTPEFAVPPLKALIEQDYTIVAVYTQPDRPSGRGQKLTESPIKQFALSQHLPIEQPKHFRDDAVLKRLKSYQADIMIVTAYGLLLPETVLNSFPFGCLNIHASLLPRWRGAAPIQRAIIAGDQCTGITLMQMTQSLDQGPYYRQREITISDRDTGQTLHDKLKILGAETLVKILPRIMKAEMIPKAQNESEASYANKLRKEEAKINWHEPARLIERKIRAFNPWPVAFTNLNNQPVRIWQARVVDENFVANKVGVINKIDPSGIEVTCGKGVLSLQTVQFASKKALPVAQILTSRHHGLKVDGYFS